MDGMFGAKYQEDAHDLHCRGIGIIDERCSVWKDLAKWPTKRVVGILDVVILQEDVKRWQSYVNMHERQ